MLVVLEFEFEIDTRGDIGLAVLDEVLSAELGVDIVGAGFSGTPRSF